MRFRRVRTSVLAGLAVFACLLASQAALGVAAISSEEGASASGDPFYGDGGDLGFGGGRAGPNLGSFQASYAGSAVKDGASASGSASIDFGLGINAEAGTIAGTFVGAAACELTVVGDGAGDSCADSSMYLVFSVPEGQQGVYRLRGSIQRSEGYAWVGLSDWDPTTGEAGHRSFAVTALPGPFELSGVLAPGFYELTAGATANVYLGGGTGTVGEAASVNLDFAIVPEPLTAVLILSAVVGGAAVRRRR